ncbi:MAG: hypothetical protein ABGZ53_20540, partial [Fuerstiella sp.]
MRVILAGLEPVDNLEVTYSLEDGGDGAIVNKECDYYWQTSPVQRLFVRWDEKVWPPDSTVAEALAAGLCEALSVSAFEPLLAMIRATSDDERRRLLVRATAPHNDDALLHKRDLLTRDKDTETPPSSGDVSLPEITKTVTQDDPNADVVGSPSNKASDDDVEQRPLWNPADLAFDGEPPRVVTGVFERDASSASTDSDHPGTTPPGSGNGRGTRTDLTLLDSTGMSLAMRYESLRLSPKNPKYALFDSQNRDTWGTALVFDVSTPEAIVRARQSCPRFDAALRSLVDQHGTSAEYPGFDILSLNTSE